MPVALSRLTTRVMMFALDGVQGPDPVVIKLDGRGVGGGVGASGRVPVVQQPAEPYEAAITRTCLPSGGRASPDHLAAVLRAKRAGADVSPPSARGTVPTVGDRPQTVTSKNLTASDGIR